MTDRKGYHQLHLRKKRSKSLNSIIRTLKTTRLDVATTILKGKMSLITDVKNAAVKSEDFAFPNVNVLLSVKSKRLLVRAKVEKTNAEPRSVHVSTITSNVYRVFV